MSDDSTEDFNPDAYIASATAPQQKSEEAFNPDEYISNAKKDLATERVKKPSAEVDGFNPDDYLREAGMKGVPEKASPGFDKGNARDILVGLGKGALQLPEQAVGVADTAQDLNILPLSPITGLAQKYVGEKLGFKPGKFGTQLAEKAGELTGFQPGKWNEEAEKDYSPEMQQQKRNVQEAWANPDAGALDIAKAYINNPRTIGAQTAESAPGMLLGNELGSAVTGLKAAGEAGIALIKANALKVAAGTMTQEAAEKAAKEVSAAFLKHATIAGGVGEGLITAGQDVGQINSGDPQKDALAALAIGITTGAIGTASGMAASKLGLRDLQTFLASHGMAQPTAVATQGASKGLLGVAGRAAGRVAAGAIQEGPIEEGTQALFESGIQNLANNAPITQGMGQNIVESSLAGAAMGGPMNVIPGASAKEERPQIAPRPVNIEPEAPSERAATQPSGQKIETEEPTGLELTPERKSVIENVLSKTEERLAAGQEWDFIPRPIINAAESLGIEHKGKSIEEILPEIKAKLNPPPTKEQTVTKAVADVTPDLNTLASSGVAGKMAATVYEQGQAPEQIEAAETATKNFDIVNPVLTPEERTRMIRQAGEEGISEEGENEEIPEEFKTNVDSASPEQLTLQIRQSAFKSLPEEQQTYVKNTRDAKIAELDKTGEVNAKQEQIATRPDGRGSAQPGIREEGGNTTVSGPGLLPSGPGQGNLQQKASEAPAQQGLNEFDAKAKAIKDLISSGKPVEAYFQALKTKTPLSFEKTADGRTEIHEGGLLTEAFRTQDRKWAQHKALEAAFRKQNGITDKMSPEKVAYLERQKSPVDETPAQRELAQKLFTVNGQVVDHSKLSDAQKASWDKADEEFKSASAYAARLGDAGLEAKTKKAAAMTLSAERRRITGLFTAKETARNEVEANRITVGKPVTSTDGLTGVAMSNPAFGNVKVQLEDGTVKNFKYKDLKVDTRVKEASVDQAAAQLPATKDGVNPELKPEEKPRVRFDGLPLKMENEAGFKREGTDKDGKKWSQVLHDHYAEISMTEGADGDHIDAFIKPGAETSPKVFIVDQNDPKTGEFDEQKVMLGYNTIDEARKAYLRNYEPGWDGMGRVTSMTMDDFKSWLKNEDTTKPASEAKPAETTTPELFKGTKFIHNEAELTKRFEDHQDRVARLGYEILATSEDFKDLNPELTDEFLHRHDRAKLDHSPEFLAKHGITEEEHAIHGLAKIYGKNIADMTGDEKTTAEAIRSLTNRIDNATADEFFKENGLFNPDGTRGTIAEKLIKVEHIADLVDRGMDPISAEEFNKVMEPASKFLKDEIEQKLAAQLEERYKKTLEGGKFEEEFKGVATPRFSRPEYFRGDEDQNKVISGLGGVTLIKNPTRARAYKMALSDTNGEIRLLVDEKTGNSYIATASNNLHETMRYDLKLANRDGRASSDFEKVTLPADEIYDYRPNHFSDDTAPQFSRPDNNGIAKWTEGRVINLLREYAYSSDDNKTQAFAAMVSPDQFLNVATESELHKEVIKRETLPIDQKRLADESQPIMLFGELQEDSYGNVNFIVDGHEGRHRMTALKEAGVKAVPVVFSIGHGENLTPENLERVNVSGQKFVHGTGKGFTTGFKEATPINYANINRLKADFQANGEEAIQFSRPDSTEGAFEGRVSEILKGAKPNRDGVPIIGASNVLDVLGYGNIPITLDEKAAYINRDDVRLGMDTWKKVPGWLQHPTAVFAESDYSDDLVVVPDEMVYGAPVRVLLTPNADNSAFSASIQEAWEYTSSGESKIGERIDKKLLRYIDTENSEDFLRTSGGLQLNRVMQSVLGTNKTIKTEADLKANEEAIRFSRTQTTKDNYEKRIDELFSGAAPDNTNGVKILDKSDLIDMLGYNDYAVVLAEKHAVIDGIYNHGLTKEDWKKLPEWIDNPVAVFKRDKDSHLTFIAPELKNGNPIVIGLTPEGGVQGARGKQLNVVLTAYEKNNGRIPVERMINEGNLLYLNTRKSPEFNRGSGLRLPSSAADTNRFFNAGKAQGRSNIIRTEKDLVKYNKANDLRGTSGLQLPRVSTHLSQDLNKNLKFSRGSEYLLPSSATEPGNIIPAERAPVKSNTFATKEEAQQHLVDNFGKGIDRLADSEVLNLDYSKDSWPEAVKKVAQPSDEAAYYGGKIYVDLTAVSKERLQPVLLHELGEHFNLKRMMGSSAYEKLQDQIKNQAANPKSETAKVWAEVKRSYTYLNKSGVTVPLFPEGSEKFISEVIAKLGERNPKAPWYRRILSQIKAFLVQHGLAKGFVTGTLGEKDLHALLVASVKSAARGYDRTKPVIYSGNMVEVPAFEKGRALPEKININGVERHTTNSEGNQIAPDIEGIKNFWKWFGDSTVVDEQGRPKVMYHGTPFEFNIFDVGFNPNFFTADKKYAKVYGKKIMPVYLKVENVLDTRDKAANDFYNEKFIPRFKGKFPTLSGELTPLERGEPVSFIWADQLFSTMKGLAREGVHNYDGILVDEGSTPQLAKSKEQFAIVTLNGTQIKSAVGNTGEFNPEEPDIRFSFAGEKARTADKHSLAYAKELIGYGFPAEAIRRETGWKTGMDGKWRFEIDDSNAESKYPNDRYFEEAVWAAHKDGVERSKNKNYIPMVKDILDHPALFTAYPALKHIRVGTLPRDSKAEARLVHRHGGWWIEARMSLNTDRWISSMLHELQHGIQVYEDFALGASPDVMAKHIEKWTPKNQGTLNGLTNMLNSAIRLGYKEPIEAVTELRDQHIIDSATEAYWRVAGEEEARDTQARRNMTMEERRNAPTREAKDVKGGVIITFNGVDFANMPEPANAAGQEATPERIMGTPENVETIFNEMESTEPKEVRDVAMDKIAGLTNAERVQYVEDNFIDILSDLEQQGRIEIKC